MPAGTGRPEKDGNVFFHRRWFASQMDSPHLPEPGDSAIQSSVIGHHDCSVIGDQASGPPRLLTGLAASAGGRRGKGVRAGPIEGGREEMMRDGRA